MLYWGRDAGPSRKEEDGMDLHDYRDVAENYDAYLDAMYARQDAYEGFREFYLELAREYGGGGTIDIACGTGAVLLTLARAGLDAEGTDISEAMCAVAREKAARMGLSPRIMCANMTEFRPGRTYSLAVIARSGFLHLTDPADQRRALLNIRECLTEGGVLSLNTFAPNPSMQAGQMRTRTDDYTFRLEYTNRDGLRERIYNAVAYDPRTQVMYGNWKFETLDAEGNVIGERVRPLRMRQTYRQEMLYLAELCGYEVLAVYGDYHRSAEDTGRYVWLLRRKG